MNDNDLSTIVRESVTQVRSATPVDRVIGRGRRIRTRRRIPQVAGAAFTAAAGVALAVTALQPHGQAAGHPAGVQLAAWTVDKEANGDIDVTIRQLEDPAGLAATLRADGIPAVFVSFKGAPRLPVSCWDLDRPHSRIIGVRIQGGVFTDVIHLSALPRGAGIYIFTWGNAVRPVNSTSPVRKPLALGFGVVKASPECTG
jgi:hypothetical protein